MFTFIKRPKVLMAGHHFHNDKDYAVVYKNDNFHSLHIYDYSSMVKIGKDIFKLSSGDITIIPQGTPYSYHVPKGGKHLVFHFTDGAGPENREGYILPHHLSRPDFKDTYLREGFEILHYSTKAYNSNISADMADISFCEFLMKLIYQTGNENETVRRAEKSINKVAFQIENNLEEPLDVEQMCRLAGLSQNYLAKLFKQYYGMSMSHYQMTRRIELARFLLTSSDLPVKEIGNRVGMADAQYFNKQFRKYTGSSPSKMRNATT